MSKEKKITLPDPSEIKEEILAKYPKKVAKKREKSMEPQTGQGTV